MSRGSQHLALLRAPRWYPSLAARLDFLFWPCLFFWLAGHMRVGRYDVEFWCVHGSPLNFQDLERAGVRSAATVLLLNNYDHIPGNRCACFESQKTGFRLAGVWGGMGSDLEKFEYQSAFFWGPMQTHSYSPASTVCCPPTSKGNDLPALLANTSS